jgi:heme/copper-type cytochrome/quinol oxidase subunit 4
MTASETAAGAGRTTSVVVRAGLGILAVFQAIIGVWALFAPTSFYSSFPLPGHPWVSLLPPYNEHLVGDVGELSLALTVVLAAAAVIGQRLLSAVAVAAIAVYAVPHAIFHFLHLEGFPTSDAIAQTIGIAFQLLVIAAVALLLWRDRSRTTRP